MRTTIDLSVERLRRLPQDPTDVWEGGLVRAPRWVKGEGEPYRPLLPLWRSAESDRIGGATPLQPTEAGTDATVQQSMLEALLHLSRQPGVECRPARVAVRGARLAALLQGILAEAGIEVDLVEEIPLIDELMSRMTADLAGPEAALNPLEAPGVTVERMRAFAEAAVEFYRAAPWNHLSNEDLVRVESEAPSRELGWFTVLGAGGLEYGLGFYAARKHHELIHSGAEPEEYLAKRGGWSLTFDHPAHVPLADADLWEAEGLPVAGARAYPLLVGFHPREGFRRADAAVLGFAEGMLRALAESTEDDFDSGRWSRTVITVDGVATVVLSLPAMLEYAGGETAGDGAHPGPTRRRGGSPAFPDRRIMERTMRDLQRAIATQGLDSVEEVNEFLSRRQGERLLHAPALSPEEKAQLLFYEALENTGRVRIKLAREALRAWPDCADALVLLAEEMPDPDRRRELYRLALSAGERGLGPEVFRDSAGHFWGMLETRPYMRARLGYAHCLEEAGQAEEAVAHLLELLRLNPSDNQGMRFSLIPRLLELGRNEEASNVLAQYEDDRSPTVAYSRALSEFRRTGDTAEARRLLGRATRSNPHVPSFLLGSEALRPAPGETYRIGSEEEAGVAADELNKSWKETPGALEWLRTARRERKKERRDKRKQGRKG